MLLNCPSLEVNDDYMSWRGCGINGTAVSNKVIDHMQCKLSGMTAEHISACVLPDDQLAVVPNYLLAYYTAVMAGSQAHATSKLLKKMLKENVVFQNAVHATFGLYGKYFEACKKLSSP